VRRIAAFVTLLALLAGCGGASKPLHASSAREQAWVSSAQDWLAVESFQGNFRGCDRRLAGKVGPSPARDLQPLDSAVGRMCSDFARAYRDLDASFKRNDADLYQRSQNEMHRAERQIAPVRALVDAWHPGSSGGLPTRGGAVESSRIEPRLSAAASAVAHTPVTVRCWSEGDWPRIKRVARAEGAGAVVADLAGLADGTTETIDLSPEGCRDLVLLTYQGVHSGASEAFGITLLAHEATHLREDAGASEAVTECYAMQRVVEAAPKLGVSRPEARRLARTYWDELYPENLPEYVTPDCHNGGPFDLHPNDPTWP
jgi:hypothetical protein